MSDMEQKNAALQELAQIKYSSHGGAAVFPICMKVMSEYLEKDREVLQQAACVLGRWVERFYAKDIQIYDTWHDMLLNESLYVSHLNTDECDTTDPVDADLYSRLPVQKDVIQDLIDDRNQEAKYLLELAVRQKEGDNTQLERAARHFQKVSAYAEEILYLIGEWLDTDATLRHLADRKVREELAKLVLYAKAEDVAALGYLNKYLQ